MTNSKFSSVGIADGKNGALCRRKAAEYLAISTRLLDQLASAGRLNRVKIGTKTVFLVSDLDEFLNSCRIITRQ